MIALKQVIDIIEQFANAHLMIKKFGFEFKEQMQNLATVDEKYPYFFVVPVASNIGQFTNEFELDVYCVDRLQTDRTNTKFITSDTQLILTHFATWLEDGNFDFEVDKIYSMSTINNDLLDNCAGWQMRVRINVERISLCEIPFNN